MTPDEYENMHAFWQAKVLNYSVPGHEAERKRAEEVLAMMEELKTVQEALPQAMKASNEFSESVGMLKATTGNTASAITALKAQATISQLEPIVLALAESEIGIDSSFDDDDSWECGACGGDWGHLETCPQSLARQYQEQLVRELDNRNESADNH